MGANPTMHALRVQKNGMHVHTKQVASRHMCITIKHCPNLMLAHICHTKYYSRAAACLLQLFPAAASFHEHAAQTALPCSRS